MNTTHPIKSSRLHTRAVYAVALALGAASVATAQVQNDEGVQRILLDRSLETQPIGLLEIADDGIVYVEATGLVRSASLSEITAIFTPSVQDEPTPWIELTDGQRFTGWLARGAESADDIFWDSPVFGSMRLSLDDVRMVVLDPMAITDAAGGGADDRVILRNGDVLTGFIEHLGDTIAVSTGSGEISIPLDRLALAQFANDATGRMGMFIWTADGTVARVTSLRTNRQTIETTRAPIEQDTEANEVADKYIFPLKSLRAIVPAAETFHPLASLEFTGRIAPPSRRWTPQPRFGPSQGRALDAATIEIPGPMRLEWALPQHSHLITFDASLPARSHMWGDCDLIVSARVAGEDVLIAQSHLSGDMPTASVIAEFPHGATGVSITLDTARFGPAQDEAILRNAIVLTDQ